MYKPIFNKRNVLKFIHFNNHSYSLFSVIGKEVIIGVLSVATLQHATANSISIDTDRIDNDTMATDRNVVLEEVSVTGTRAPLTVSQQARMVTVLSRENIQTAPVQSVNDLLKYAVGVDVRQKGPLGALTDVGIRGGNSEQITVLLNGINIGDAQTGHNTFDFPVDISEIERVEILEGPAGRVYGTSSLLGAINVVTRTPLKTSLSTRIEGGSYGYLNVGARANLAKDKWNNQISGSYIRSDGYLRNKKGSLNADYNVGKAFYQGNYNDELITVNWHAGLSVKNFGANTFYSVKYDDQFEHTLKTFTAVQAENKKGVFHVKPSIYWNRSMDRFELFRNAPDKYPFNYHRTDVYGINLNAYFDWSFGRTAFGAEMRHEDLISSNLGEKLYRPHHIHGTDKDYTNGFNRTNMQFVLEHNLILNRFTLSAGIIAVKNSQADMSMQVYPGIDISYRFGDAWKLYASYNTSLRMPSITELFYSVGGHKANKHLRPEELSALETGIKYNTVHIIGKASIFYNHQKNLIDWISDGTLDENGAVLWKSVNFGKINTLGIEASIDVNMLNLIPSQHIIKKVGIAYSFLNQNEKEHEGLVSKYVLEYLKNKLCANMQFNLWKKLDLGLNYRLQHRMGSYIDVDNNRHSYATYGVLDARLSWSNEKWTAYVEGNNLLDCNYLDYGNVPQPGIWAIAGCAITL
ncbi:UNVERIFIED_CONTAM: TonB-dependent receptor [Prevotella sp. 15_C9]